MSYADVAASGPSQTAEQARAPPPPEIEHTDLSASTSTSEPSLIDVDSPHVSSVPSTFPEQSIQTDTQADRLKREAEEKERVLKRKAEEARSRATAAAKKAEAKAKENSGTTVLLGNTGVLVALGGVLGIGAYRKYAKGELSWGVIGAWAGVLGVFAVADITLSRWFLQKYPPKK